MIYPVFGSTASHQVPPGPLARRRICILALAKIICAAWCFFKQTWPHNPRPRAGKVKTCKKYMESTETCSETRKPHRKIGHQITWAHHVSGRIHSISSICCYLLGRLKLLWPSTERLHWTLPVPSGKLPHSELVKSQFFMGKSTISIAIFNSYFDIPRG
jgi:hypothetical protein